MFTDKIEPIISNGVETIGGKGIIHKGIATVSWSCNNDEGKLCRNKWNNLIYFPDSPLKKISATALAEFTKDDERTWLLTKIKYYIFT